MAKAARKIASKKVTQYYGTGRRKTAIARVFAQAGTGKITIEGLSVSDYLRRKTACMVALQVLDTFNLNDKVDLYITVKGGGVMGQAGAIRLGVARALAQYDDAEVLPFKAPASNDQIVLVQPVETEAEEGSEGEGSSSTTTVAAVVPLTLRRALRKGGFLTRDSRSVERKKVGHRKARKVEQYSKR